MSSAIYYVIATITFRCRQFGDTPTAFSIIALCVYFLYLQLMQTRHSFQDKQPEQPNLRAAQ